MAWRYQDEKAVNYNDSQNLRGRHIVQIIHKELTSTCLELLWDFLDYILKMYSC